MDISQIQNIQLHFILSTARTGSTLLSSMLNMSPDILSVSEEPFAYNLYPKYSKISTWTSDTIKSFCHDFYLFSEGKLEPQFGTHKDLLNSLETHKDHLDVHTAVKLAYLCFFPKKDKSRVNFIVDKELKFHDFLEEAAAYYPESRFIVLYRDPRDNTLVKVLRKQKQNGKAYPWYFALVWNHEYGMIERKAERIGRDRFLRVRYEDLMTEPEAQLQRICSFLGMPYNDVMMQYDGHMKKEISASTASTTVIQHLELLHEGLTQKVNTDKVGFWKNKLAPEQSNLVWKTCSTLAEKVGYTRDSCTDAINAGDKKWWLYLKFCLNKKWIPYVYYNIPYAWRYMIKKIKYGRNFKNDKYATPDFYKATLLK